VARQLLLDSLGAPAAGGRASAAWDHPLATADAVGAAQGMPASEPLEGSVAVPVQVRPVNDPPVVVAPAAEDGQNVHRLAEGGEMLVGGVWNSDRALLSEPAHAPADTG